MELTTGMTVAELRNILDEFDGDDTIIARNENIETLKDRKFKLNFKKDCDGVRIEVDDDDGFNCDSCNRKISKETGYFYRGDKGWSDYSAHCESCADTVNNETWKAIGAENRKYV